VNSEWKEKKNANVSGTLNGRHQIELLGGVRSSRNKTAVPLKGNFHTLRKPIGTEFLGTRIARTAWDSNRPECMKKRGKKTTHEGHSPIARSCRLFFPELEQPHEIEAEKGKEKSIKNFHFLLAGKSRDT